MLVRVAPEHGSAAEPLQLTALEGEGNAVPPHFLLILPLDYLSILSVYHGQPWSYVTGLLAGPLYPWPGGQQRGKAALPSKTGSVVYPEHFFFASSLLRSIMDSTLRGRKLINFKFTGY